MGTTFSRAAAATIPHMFGSTPCLAAPNGTGLRRRADDTRSGLSRRGKIKAAIAHADISCRCCHKRPGTVPGSDGDLTLTWVPGLARDLLPRLRLLAGWDDERLRRFIAGERRLAAGVITRGGRGVR